MGRFQEKKRELNPIEKELTELQKQFIGMSLKSERGGRATPSNSSLSVSSAGVFTVCDEVEWRSVVIRRPTSLRDPF